MNDCPNYPNLLLVAGTGRNSGKTSFVCQVCEEWNATIPLVCIKISNHIHLQTGTKRIIQNPEYTIYEETQASSDKDTSRMLQAGASNVYFIEADREYVYPAFQKLSEIIPVNAAIICESGALRKYIKPSLFILVNTMGTIPKESAKDIMVMADKIFNFESGNLQIPYKSVVFIDHQWKLNLA